MGLAPARLLLGLGPEIVADLTALLERLVAVGEVGLLDDRVDLLAAGTAALGTAEMGNHLEGDVGASKNGEGAKLAHPQIEERAAQNTAINVLDHDALEQGVHALEVRAHLFSDMAIHGLQSLLSVIAPALHIVLLDAEVFTRGVDANLVNLDKGIDSLGEPAKSVGLQDDLQTLAVKVVRQVHPITGHRLDLTSSHVGCDEGHNPLLGQERRGPLHPLHPRVILGLQLLDRHGPDAADGLRRGDGRRGLDGAGEARARLPDRTHFLSRNFGSLSRWLR
mmetsp:Transcript_29667/g.78165  ORF Transcript_29667/g.78165 Transcript_29667/m.78165 type:complete len:279 (+) Transcript_29667:541-1377(+)